MLVANYQAHAKFEEDVFLPLAKADCWPPGRPHGRARPAPPHAPHPLPAGDAVLTARGRSPLCSTASAVAGQMPATAFCLFA